MLCVNASIPVAAVIRGGRSSVSSGSANTVLASSAGEKMIFLMCVWSSEMTDERPTSDPVPAVVGNAMKYVGYRYVFGGTSPAGFDCSGFVYYIHSHSGAPVGRGMWQQYNGGGHISMNALQPGDTVFFANTYMPGLSHVGIYVGDGQFVDAGTERTGVRRARLSDPYWAARFVGARRISR